MMYTISKNLKLTSIILMVIGFIGLTYGFLAAPSNYEEAQKMYPEYGNSINEVVKVSDSSNDKVYNVNVDPDFHIAVDTTFSSIEILKYEVTDTIYTISMLNSETNSLDTILVNSRLFNRYKNDEKFEEIINFESIDRVEKQSNYLRRRFHLSNDLIYCPISDSNKNKKFILEIENNKDNDQIFKITSPVSKKDRELRYGIFRYNPGNEEYILGGVKSWAEK